MIDALRYLTLLLILFDLLMLPSALRVHTRASRTTLLIAGIYFYFISGAGRIVTHLHQRVVPYGLPMIGAGSLFVTIYIVQAIWAQHQGRYS